MSKNCLYIRKTLDLVRKMIILADKGEMSCDDYSSTVLFGVVRDCAYKIKARAEEERDRLKTYGGWDSENLCCNETDKEAKNES